MEDVLRIVNDVKAGVIKPIYLLMGEEPYYIDKLSEFMEENLLSEDERGFNQTILYGRDVSIEDIISTSQRFPMMAERQVVVVREAQDLIKTIDRLETYAENPMPSTVLVICYKYKTVDKRKRVVKMIEKTGVVFDSKKIYENQVPDWIKRVLSGKNYAIEPKAAAMLTEFLGNNLAKINNELEKLQIIFPKGSTITSKNIEENIGISKDYNNFELVKAVADRNVLRAYKIADYFAQNQKDNPVFVTTGILFGYFSQLLQYHGMKNKEQKHVYGVLKIQYLRHQDLTAGHKNYPMRKVSAIVETLRETDIKAKGIGASLQASDLLKEMLYKIFN